MPNVSFPDMSCFLCDGNECILKRIGNTVFAFSGIACNGFDIGGKERCKIFINAQKEKLTFFLKKCDENV